MWPKSHILLGLLFSIIIWIIFPQLTLSTILIIFLSSVLIDIDHYAVYVYRKKQFSLKKALKYYADLQEIFSEKVKQNPKLKYHLHLLHTIEILLIVIFLSLYFNFFYILIGFSFHLITDTIDLAIREALRVREFSLIRYIFSAKKNYL